MYFNIHTHNTCQINNIVCIQSLFHSELSITDNNLSNFYSIGIHPWHTENIDIAAESEKISSKAHLNNVVAIGECGIDKLKGADLQSQIKIFELHVAIAEKANKPIIIHCVKAFDEIIEVKRRSKPKVSWIIHGFRQSPELAKQLINEGFILSFGEKALLNEQLAQSLASLLTHNTFFLETDNGESSSIIELYKNISELLGISENNLINQLHNSFESVFKTAVNA
jgi:TatD DNase family protein